MAVYFGYGLLDVEEVFRYPRVGQWQDESVGSSSEFPIEFEHTFQSSDVLFYHYLGSKEHPAGSPSARLSRESWFVWTSLKPETCGLKRVDRSYTLKQILNSIYIYIYYIRESWRSSSSSPHVSFFSSPGGKMISWRNQEILQLLGSWTTDCGSAGLGFPWSFVTWFKNIIDIQKTGSVYWLWFSLIQFNQFFIKDYTLIISNKDRWLMLETMFKKRYLMNYNKIHFLFCSNKVIPCACFDIIPFLSMYS